MMNKLDLLITIIPENKKIMGEKLAEEIAFCYRTLQKLRADIDANGTLDKCGNGSMKMSESLKGYNTTLKSYQNCIKQFTELLPKDEQKTVNPVLEFLSE